MSFTGYILLLSSVSASIFLNKYFPEDELISPVSNQSQKSLSAVLDKKRISYESIEKIDDYYLVKTNDGGEILISDRKNLDEQVSSLQLISSRLKIEGKTFRRLDFRYEKTVITF